MTSSTSSRRDRRRWFVPIVAAALTLTLGIGPAGAALPAGPSTEHTSAGTEGARELVAMSEDGVREVYVGRGEAKGVWLTDRSIPQTWSLTTGDHFNPAISDDGNTIAYVEYGSTRPVFVMDVTDPTNPGPSVLASKSTSGQSANGLSDFPSLNADGTIIAFHSMATNLDPDTPLPSSGGPNKVYVRDLVAETTEMVSVDNSGAAQAGNGIKPDLSADGNMVAFASEADLAGPPLGTLDALAHGQPGPPDGGEEEEETETFVQIWVRDRTAESTSLASSDSDGIPGNGSSALVYGPTISADGTVVAFESDATNLVPADTNAHTDAFHKDMDTGVTTRVSERTPFDEFGAFHAVTPERVLDTRDPLDPVGPDETIQVPIGDAVPPSAVAVSVNVTVTAPTSDGWLTVWPAGETKPPTSTINFVPGQTVANAATLSLGVDGEVSINNSAGSTHVVVDVTGWYDDAQLSAGGGFVPMPPVRALDTRDALGPVGAGETVELPVAGSFGVPSDATAVALSVTVASPTAESWLTVWPTGDPEPLASTLNFTPGAVVANNAVVGVGTDGSVSIRNAFGTTQLIVDVVGWFDAALPNGGFTPLTPERLFDSRPSSAVTSASPKELTVIDTGGVPAMGVTAVALNVTVTSPSAAGWLTVFPTGTIKPLASNLNFVAGQTVAVQVLAQVGAEGKVTLAVDPAVTTHMVVDVVGWYSGVQAFDGGLGAVVSADGAHVAFESLASTLTAGDVNGVLDAFVRDLSPALTERVSVVDETLGGTEATGTRTDGNTGETVPQKNGTDVAVSGDGSMVAFMSHGDLTNDRGESEHDPGELSTEPQIYTRTRAPAT